MSAKFVLHPEDLSVVVASNLNADILSDLGSALAGSLGLAASANINPERRFPTMFEPVHGSAPDIAGQGISNPVGTIASGALMLRPLRSARRGRAGWRPRSTSPPPPGVMTRDVGGTANTDEVTDAIIDSPAEERWSPPDPLRCSGPAGGLRRTRTAGSRPAATRPRTNEHFTWLRPRGVSDRTPVSHPI